MILTPQITGNLDSTKCKDTFDVTLTAMEIPEPRDVAHLSIHRVVPTTKNDPGNDVGNAKIEKLYARYATESLQNRLLSVAPKAPPFPLFLQGLPFILLKSHLPCPAPLHYSACLPPL